MVLSNVIRFHRYYSSPCVSRVLSPYCYVITIISQNTYREDHCMYNEYSSIKKNKKNSYCSQIKVCLDKTHAMESLCGLLSYYPGFISVYSLATYNIYCQMIESYVSSYLIKFI